MRLVELPCQALPLSRTLTKARIQHRKQKPEINVRSLKTNTPIPSRLWYLMDTDAQICQSGRLHPLHLWGRSNGHACARVVYPLIPQLWLVYRALPQDYQYHSTQGCVFMNTKNLYKDTLVTDGPNGLLKYTILQHMLSHNVHYVFEATGIQLKQYLSMQRWMNNTFNY